MSPSSPPRRRIPLTSFVLLVLSGMALVLGCFFAEEPALTPEDRAWATEDLSSVEVLGPTDALVTSLSGSIYRTTDGARRFRRVYADPDVPLHDLSMADAEFGWAVGDGRILATNDGGRSWHVQLHPTDRDEMRLRSVYAIDREHVLAVGFDGVRLRTEDGGRTWHDRSAALSAGGGETAADPGPTVRSRESVPIIREQADLYDVFCSESPNPDCVSLGALGGSAFSRDLGDSWIVSNLASPFPFEPIRLQAGDADLPEEAIARLQALAQSQSEEKPISIRIEAVASAREISEIGHARDPEALFEILEARALDVEIALEEAGVADDRIWVRGAPAWTFAEILDDDPNFLERYWRQRSDREPGVFVYVDDDRVMRSGHHVTVRNEAGEEASVVVAVGSHGAVWRSLDGGANWVASEVGGKTELRALTGGPAGLVAVGAEGTIERLEAGGEAGPSIVPEPGRDAPVRAAQALNDVSYSDDGRFALIVGDAGGLLELEASGKGWQVVEVMNE